MHKRKRPTINSRISIKFYTSKSSIIEEVSMQACGKEIT